MIQIGPGGGGCKDLQAENVPTDNWAKDPELNADVMDHYRAQWELYRMDEIPDEVQGVLFGGIINQGPRVVSFLQAELADHDKSITVDGHLGDLTLTAISKVDPVCLWKGLWKRRAEAYRDTANKRPEDAQFLLGWLNRLGFGA
jgi:lysozyme family protein